ncbi:MAG: hypothetical protein WBG08_13110 [Litorimonas sp.]
MQGTLEIVADRPTEEAAFWLNRGLAIDRFDPSVPATIDIEDGIVVGEWDKPNTRRVTLRFEEPLATGERVTVDLAYGGSIEDESVEWGRGIVTPDWVELSLGTLWYPYWQEEPLLRSRTSVGLPDGYTAIGPGEVRRDENGRWIVEPGKAILGRITFAASPNYTVASRDLSPSLEARLHTLGPDPRAEAILARTESAFRYYEKLIGAPRSGSETLTMILGNEDIGIPQPRMAFATGGDYIALGIAPPMDQDFQIAHEVAHFWWILGASGTPDEFMTESLAEFVAWRFGEKVWGDDWLLQKTERAERVSASITGSMLDAGEFDGRQTLLYFRGPLRLWQLQQRIGQEAMDGLLAAAHEGDVSTIRAFIRIIGEREGPQTAQWFENSL